MPALIPIEAGERYEKWTVLGPAPTSHGRTRSCCQCDCGTIAIVQHCHLRAGRSTRCIHCRAKATREQLQGLPRRTQQNSQSPAQVERRIQRRKRLYGLTEAGARLVEEVAECQATGKPLNNNGHVDHCHGNHHVRGVLDPQVNTALSTGLSPEDLEAMAAYLRRTGGPDFDWEADRRAYLTARYDTP